VATTWYLLENGAESTLDGAVLAGDGTITVADASSFPATGPFHVTVWDMQTFFDPARDDGSGTGGGMEIMLVTGVAGNDFTVTRAQSGTAAVGHADANEVYELIVVDIIEQITGVIDAHHHDAAGDGAAVSHADLSNLGADDHAQYLLADGTRDLTGDWTIDTNNVTLTDGIIGAADIYKGGDPYSDRTILAFDYIGGFEGTNPVIACGTGVEWDEYIREIGNVLYEPTDTGYEYKIFYSGHNGAYVQDTVYIGYAYSSDGISWTKAGQVIVRSLEDPYVVNVSGTYHMYAEDKAGGGTEIRKYHSSDCVTWVDDGIVLSTVGATWESQDVSSPVVWIEGATWYMLYEGRETAGQQGAIGIATSADGSTWAKEGTNPVFEGSDIEWADRVACDDLLKIGDVYYMLFHGWNGIAWRMGMAVSSDKLLWKDYYGSPFGMYDESSVSVATVATVMCIYSDQYVFYYADALYSSGIMRGYPMSVNYWDKFENNIIYQSGNVEINNGTLYVSDNIGIGIAPTTEEGMYFSNTNLNTADDFTGIKSIVTKTLGATDADDHFRGIYSQIALNQAAGTIGYLQGGYVEAKMSAGEVGDVSNARDVRGLYLLTNMDAGKLWGNVYGEYFSVDQEAAHEVTGSIYGQYVRVDADGTVGGTVYMHYLNETSGVDWGYYHSGTAPSYLGGSLDVIGGYKDNGVAGIDTTFVDADGNTITVSGGIVTAKTAP